MGCGAGEDVQWWATLETRATPPVPYNYTVFAVDKDPQKLAKIPDRKNIKKINRDFNDQKVVPVKVDLMWSHDSLQYSHNPLETLRTWNDLMSVNGMLILSVPQSNGVAYNQYYSRTYSHCYYNFTPTSLIYMLAVNGFDCRDAYLLKKWQDPWIHMAVYKTDIEPRDPRTTSWFDLIGTGLLHPTVENSINRHGHLRQEDIVMPWLDRENYFPDYVSQWTEIPEGAEKIENGVRNKEKQSDETTLYQKESVTKRTNMVKAVGITRPPKVPYKK